MEEEKSEEQKLQPSVEPPVVRDSFEVWLRTRPFGMAALIAGITSLIVTCGVQMNRAVSFFSAMPPLWLTLPFAGLVLLLSSIALQRKEPSWGLCFAALACAGSAIVLGWVVALALVGILLLVIFAAIVGGF